MVILVKFHFVHFYTYLLCYSIFYCIFACIITLNFEISLFLLKIVLRDEKGGVQKEGR